MGLFNRKRNVEQPPIDPNDPIAALQLAQDALAESKVETDENGPLERLSSEESEQIAALIAQAKATLEDKR
jgi:hypothetical protein